MDKLEMAKNTWRFFLAAHKNDCDTDAVIDEIVDETRELTLREVGEWLMPQSLYMESDKSLPLDKAEYVRVYIDQIESLKQGKMPD